MEHGTLYLMLLWRHTIQSCLVHIPQTISRQLLLENIFDNEHRWTYWPSEFQKTYPIHEPDCHHSPHTGEEHPTTNSTKCTPASLQKLVQPFSWISVFGLHSLHQQVFIIATSTACNWTPTSSKTMRQTTVHVTNTRLQLCICIITGDQLDKQQWSDK